MNESVFPQAAFLQFPVVPGAVDENIRSMLNLIEKYRPAPNTLVALPELWATGFDLARTKEFAEYTPQVLEMLTQVAGRHSLYFAGSLGEAVDGSVYNTLFVVGPDGILGRLPKQHLFSALREHTVFEPGRNCVTVQTPFGLTGGFVCYDLRFPEIARELAFAGAGLVVVSALWPEARKEHWLTMLKARAIENQIYVVAANGCGNSGGVETAGNSMIIAPDGRVLEQAGTEPVCMAHELHTEQLGKVRDRFCPPGERPWRQNNNHKIVSLGSLKQQLAAIRKQGSRVAFTNGCFDLLHAGHVSYLEHARKTADCLVLGLNSDDSIRRLKGPSRPVNSQHDRALVLAALGCIDFVVIFNEDTPLQLITELLPDVLVKGADWPEDQIVGGAEVKAAGGTVERIVFEHDRSTTSIIDKIQTQSTST